MSAAGEASLYPLFLKLENRTVLVVGAGPIAERKISAALEGHAIVRVVAPDATPEVHRLACAGALHWHVAAVAWDARGVPRAVTPCPADPHRQHPRAAP